ncbi:hypothetical protein TRFO_26860 [Tritrichomonas foetus]|uniref:protein xylosyltransferase n=1 Tax=Tritrichomonas foetus TaxID=1144522 RepID=A0A1J4K7P3_9EUKA|nr:hypothetical protein TRFO_26860 [Tritrichomonas foetus]|eukprot:OHT05437.1 hypothetical protein TRFO_26860 [Tritrichomonas foetus]
MAKGLYLVLTFTLNALIFKILFTYPRSIDIFLLESSSLIGRQFQLREFIKKRNTMGVAAAIYLLKNNFDELLLYSDQINPIKWPIEVEQYIPIHSDGTKKLTTCDYCNLLHDIFIVEAPILNKFLISHEYYGILVDINLSNSSNIEKQKIWITQENTHQSSHQKFEEKIKLLEEEFVNDGNLKYYPKKNDVIIKLNEFVQERLRASPEKILFLNNSKNEKYRTNFTLIYLLTVHKNPKQVHRMIDAMNHFDVAFILYVDKKVLLNEMVNELKCYKNVFFMFPRFVVTWGHITQALSMAVLMIAAVENFPDSLYFSINSGSDYPTTPSDFIVKCLIQNHPKSYIALTKDNDATIDKRHRIKYMQGKYKQWNFQKNNLLNIFPNRRIRPIKFGHGANWFTTTIENGKKMKDYLINNAYFLNFMDWVPNCDESMFQTMFLELNLNSTLRNLRYVDWGRFPNGHPLTLNTSHYQKIIGNPCNMWARKFDYDSNKIIFDLMDHYINKLRMRQNFSNCPPLKEKL